MESIKKVLIVSPIFPPDIGGPSSYIKGLIENKPASLDLRIVAFCSANAPHKLQESQRVLFTNGVSVIRQIRLLKNILQLGVTSAVIYSQGTVTVGYASLIASRLLKKRLLLKFVGDEVWENYRKNPNNTDTLEEFYEKQKEESRILKIHRGVLLGANAIIAPSQYLKDFLVKYHQVDENKISIIPNAVEISSEATTKSTKDMHKLVYVGRLVPWKHVDQIIKAVSLARKTKSWNLTIVGDGVERSNLENLVNKLHAESWVTFMGKCSKTQTLQEIASAERLVLYSSYEGQPHALIEAMLLKTTIIASNIPPHVELLGADGLVPLNNPQALAQAVNSEIKNTRALADPFAFSWHIHISTFEKQLKKLL